MGPETRNIKHATHNTKHKTILVENLKKSKIWVKLKNMKILAIETSCDDTAIAVIAAKGKKSPCFNILSNIVSSQIKIHKKWGGVFPAMAKREHQKNLVPVLKKALEKALMLKKGKTEISLQKQKELEKILSREKGLLKRIENFCASFKKPDIDFLAVTFGPGLEPCLWAGVNFAKALSLLWNLDIIPVNHIEAHILVNFLQNQKMKFPAIALIVSGGHTQIILAKAIGKYKIIGETRDDAAGECFDKTARIIGLPYPGGPEIEKKAQELGKKKVKFNISLPRPMLFSKDYDFSFSGLKTAVLYDWQRRKEKERKSGQYKREMAYEIQEAIIEVLLKKTLKAAKDHIAKTILLGGGVTANKTLRQRFEEKIKKDLPNTKLFIPEPFFSTDNATMAGISAFFHLKGKKNFRKVEADANLRI